MNIFKIFKKKKPQPVKAGYWRTKDGKDIFYTDLTDAHLLNIKTHLANRASRLIVVMNTIEEEIGRRGLDIKEDDSFIDEDEHQPNEHF